MELNSKIIKLLQLVESKPIFMVIWSSFGLLCLILLLMGLMYLLKKLSCEKYVANLYSIIIATLLMSWIIGIVTQIILLIADISGIKMLFIWVIMCCVNFVFVYTHKKYILKLGKPGFKSLDHLSKY